MNAIFQLADSDNIVKSIELNDNSDLMIHVEKWDGQKCVIIGEKCCGLFMNGSVGLEIGEVILKNQLTIDNEFEKTFTLDNRDYSLFEELIIKNMWETDQDYIKAISEKFYIASP